QQAGMKTAVMDEILRQRDPDLKAAVEASLAGEIGRAFEKLGSNVAEVKADNIAGAVAARWLKLSHDERGRTGVMAPSHALREGINAHIRERLVREGRIAGPALETQRLVSKGYTSAEKTLVSNYAPGDVVAFHRPYKRLGVAKGDERRVERVDRKASTVHLEGADGGTVAWKPSEIGGRRGGTEVYRTETVELRAGDRIRWTRNDKGLGLVNSGTAEVMGVRNGRVAFMLEDGRRLALTPGDPQLRHLDRAWAATVHAFQGRTVDNVIAAMEANHPNLTTAKAFYVEISRARDRAELVTDDALALKERLEAVTGERLSALEGIGESVRIEREAGREAGEDARERARDRADDPAIRRLEAVRERDDKGAREKAAPTRDGPAPSSPDREAGREAPRRKAPEPEPPAKGKVREFDLGL
ncbi:MAG: ATP-binding domain-containing protein, partial [Rhodospirillaceae bacterium]|nr:ATP-binding domain-containing protein [Rhodospirillaceae bacterium]